MSLHRFLLVPLTLLLPGSPRGQDELRFGVPAGTTLERTIENGYTMRLASMRVVLDGEEIPAEAFGELDLRIEHGETYAVTDVFEAVGDEGPLRVRRTFETLAGTERTRVVSEEGDESQESRYSSALEGKSVVFERDADTDLLVAAFAQGSEGEASLLEGLEEDMDLRRLLPSGPVEPGTSWDIDPKVFQSILDPGGDMGLLEEGSEAAETSETDEAMRDNLTGEFRATFQGSEVVDGVRVARIALEVDTHTQADSAMDAEDAGPGASGTDHIETSFELTGELLWDLEHGHAHSFQLEGQNALTMVQSMRGELEGEAYEQEQTMVFEGEMRFHMRVSRP